MTNTTKTTNKMDEMIIVAPGAWIFQGNDLFFQGVLTDPEKIKEITSNLDEAIGFMRRGDAEKALQFKQPIPYAVIKRGNEIFIYERLTGGGEERLHNKLSIGVGGHMNRTSQTHTFEEELKINLLREVEEELDIDEGKFEVNTIGFINDNTNEVGVVHLGVLVTIEISEEQNVKVRETDQLSGRFISIEELKEKETYDRLENWSKLAADIL